MLCFHVHVPAVIFAHNEFMNRTDRSDQYQSNSTSMRREQRVTKSTFWLLLDATFINGHKIPISTTTLQFTRVQNILTIQQLAEPYNSTKRMKLPLSRNDDGHTAMEISQNDIGTAP